MLLEEVAPRLSLGELAALGAIFSKLAAPADRRLNAARLLRPLLAALFVEYRRLVGAQPTQGVCVSDEVSECC